MRKKGSRRRVYTKIIFCINNNKRRAGRAKKAFNPFFCATLLLGLCLEHYYFWPINIMPAFLHTDKKLKRAPRIYLGDVYFLGAGIYLRFLCIMHNGWSGGCIYIYFSYTVKSRERQIISLCHSFWPIKSSWPGGLY